MDREAEAGLPESAECRQAHAVLEEELLADGRLADERRDLLEQHLASCTECAEYAEFVRRLPEVAPVPSSAEANRATVGARETYFARRRRTRVVVASIAAIAVAAALLLVFAFVPAGPGAVEPGNGIDLELVSGRVDLGEPIASPGVLPALGREVVALERGTRLAVGDFATIALSDQARIEPVILDRETVELHLHEGMVALHVPPAKTRSVRFTVRTSLVSVTVTGTVFAVAMVGDDVRVDVVRGKVDARQTGPRAGDAIALGAGRSLAVASGELTPLDAAHSAQILELVGLAESAGLPTEPREPPAEPKPAIETTGPDDAPREPDIATDGKGKPSASDKASGDVAPAAGIDLEGLLATARTCRAERDWTCAATNLQRAVDRYPGRPEARTALVSLAEIQLRHLGRADRALKNFERYRAASPGAPLAEEALYGICRAQRALGRTADERRNLELFLEQHPSSLRASKVKARLDQLASEGE